MMSFAYGIAGVALFIVMAPGAQLIVRASSLSIPPVIILAITAVISHLASVVIGAMTVAQFQYWDAASVFGFGAMAYIFAFGAVYKSVSLDILLSLASRPGREAPLSDIVEHQVPNLLRARTAILVDGGLAACVDSSFVATTSGQKTAARIAGLRRAFGIGSTGLYDFAS